MPADQAQLQMLNALEGKQEYDKAPVYVKQFQALGKVYTKIHQTASRCLPGAPTCLVVLT